MPTNVIVNGTFDVNPGNPGFGWSGTDLETTYSENTYQGNGNTGNSVAEIDGNSTQTTVMEQTFTVAAGQTTDLVFDAAIRNDARAVAGTDGFTVEITDAAGTVIFSDTILPTTVTFQVFTFPVDFPAAGDYTLTFTEVGGNNSFGALIDDIELMVCLTADSLIDTPNGQVTVQDLRVGMLVDTLDGPKPLRWIAHKTVSAEDMSHNDKLRPVLIRADSLGAGIPMRDMQVSRHHRMLVSSAIAERMFGTRDVLISAIRLTELPGIDVINPQTGVTYFHMLFDTHSVITADGAYTESLFMGPAALKALSPAARLEIETLFPQTAKGIQPVAAAPIPDRRKQITLIERHRKNAQVIQGI